MRLARCPRPRRDQVADYHWQYLERVPDAEILAALEREIGVTSAALAGLDEERADHRYAPGKWSIKEVIGHLIDTERVFGYRALRMARGDSTPLESFEQDDFVREGRFGSRTLAGLLDELALVRRSSLALYRGFDEQSWTRSGTAGGLPVAVCTYPWLTLGHERHHRAVLLERYL